MSGAFDPHGDDTQARESAREKRQEETRLAKLRLAEQREVRGAASDVRVPTPARGNGVARVMLRCG